MRIKLLFILILLLAAFLRFYQLPEMATFDFDQEYATNFAYSVLKVFPVQLIGQGLSVEGLFMGPLYFYFLVPFFALSNLHPIGGIVASVILGLAIIFAYFLISKELFGTRAGLITAFLRAILFNELLHDWSMVPAYASELLILITWYIFYQYWDAPSGTSQTKLFPILGFIFGLYTSIHPILFPFYLVFLTLLIIKRKLPTVRIILLSLGAFIAPLLPLILFEFLHQFWEVKTFFSFFGGASKGSLHYFSLYFKFNISEFQRILNLQFISPEIFLFIFLGIFFLLILRKVGFWKNHFHPVALILTYTIFILYYAFFPQKVPEYYFLALTTLAILYASATLSLLTKHRIYVILLILILVNITSTNYQFLQERWNNPSLLTLYHKDFIVKEILKRQPKNQEFFVSYISFPGWNTGFNYLFKLYGQIPQTREASPPVYTIVIPKFLSPGNLATSSGNIGLILPE